MATTTERLEFHGIHPSPQRVAVGDYVLQTKDHPSAERVFDEAKRRLPTISQATVYNTLNLFVEKGLLKALQLEPGHTVFDPHLGPHHHFIDDDSGRIHDIPFAAVRVSGTDALEDFEIDEVQVILRGRKKAPTPSKETRLD
jgi:Fur family iron response transcriptional regulator